MSETQTKEPLAIGSDSDQSNEIQESLDGGMLATWTNRANCLDNFVGDDLEKFKRRMVCMNDTEKGGDHLNERIDLVHWMVHEIQIVDTETGEVNDCYRVVLIDKGGKAFAFVSEVLAKGVREIFRQFGTEPIEPPLPVMVKQKQTGRGHRCYTLVPVVESNGKK